MAKPPSRRRGIMLAPRADTAGPLTDLAPQPTVAASDPAAADTDSTDGSPTEAPELLDQLRRLIAGQEEQLRQQSQQLELQRQQIARQARPLTARLGVSLATLALAGIAALGYHLWPELLYQRRCCCCVQFYGYAELYDLGFKISGQRSDSIFMRGNCCLEQLPSQFCLLFPECYLVSSKSGYPGSFHPCRATSDDENFTGFLCPDNLVFCFSSQSRVYMASYAHCCGGKQVIPATHADNAWSDVR